jgi:hypothetical protein
MLLPGFAAQQRCPHRRSHNRRWKQDPAGDQRSACSQCEIYTDLAWHFHLSDVTHLPLLLCYRDVRVCQQTGETLGWIHAARGGLS